MNPYAQRRARVLAKMREQGGGVAIIPTAPEVMRNADADYPYRHDSYFYYLTGFTEPESTLVLIAGATDQTILFCREKNQEREIWDGYRYGPAAAKETFGFNTAYAIDTIDTELPKLMANVNALFYALGSSQKLDAQIQAWLNSVRAQARAGITAPSKAVDIRVLLNDMRLIKDEHEIAIMQRAADISALAHARAMRTSKAGLREYHLEAELLHEFRSQGSQFPAYGSIVATGPNACVLHYRAGDAELRDGDLVLIDAGCELDSYASDITRTFPVNGKFSVPQKTLYELVLNAQAAAIAAFQDVAFLQQGFELNCAGYKQLTQAFDQLHLTYLPSAGNFVLVKVGDDDQAGARINLELLKRGIIVRPVGNYGLPQWLRISIGLPQENAAFIDALKAILAKQ